jgi:hypothetical protein
MLSGGSMVQTYHRAIDRTNAYLGSLNRHFKENGETVKYSYHKKPIALVYDLTHDNESYAQKKIIQLATPVSVLLTFMGTFTGSTKGFDQFYSKKIQVTEMRQLYANDYLFPPTVDKS